MTTRNGTGTRATGEALGKGYGWYGAYDWDTDGTPSPPSTPSTPSTDGRRAHRGPTAPGARQQSGQTPAPSAAAATDPLGVGHLHDDPATGHDAEDTGGRVGLSLAQIGGSAAAAVSAAVVAGKLGVAGTLIGAAVASVVSTICAAYYTSFASGAHQRVRRLGTLVPARRAGAATGGGPYDDEDGAHGADDAGVGREVGAPGRRPWLRRWWVGALATFVLAIAAITVVELGLGHPVSANENSGTSVGNVLQAPATQDTPSGPATTPASTGENTPTGGATPTDVPTGSATASVPPNDGQATPDPSASASVPALHSAEPNPPQGTAPAR